MELFPQLDCTAVNWKSTSTLKPEKLQDVRWEKSYLYRSIIAQKKPSVFVEAGLKHKLFPDFGAGPPTVSLQISFIGRTEKFGLLFKNHATC